MSWISALTDLIYPQARCLACDEPRRIDVGSALCDACGQALDALRLSDYVCPRCLSPRRGDKPCETCLKGRMRHISAAFSPYRYHGAAQRLVTALKFQGVYLAAKPLQDAMLGCLDGRGYDALVPVPLHKRRLRERGFNQAAVLAEEIAKAHQLPLLDALWRRGNSRRQSSLPHDKRQENVRDQFSARMPLKGKRILLVDDVRTTGSTADACAKALLEAGASEVCLLTACVAAVYSPASSSSSESA